MRRWIGLWLLCLVLSWGIPVGYSTWLVMTYARHDCEALDVLVSVHLANRQLHEGIARWARADGC